MLGLIAFALFAQSLMSPVPGVLRASAYLPTLDGTEAPVLDTLVTNTGAYTFSSGHNCDWLQPDQPVEVWPVANLPYQAVLAPIGADGQVNTATVDDESLMCSVYVNPPLAPDMEVP